MSWFLLHYFLHEHNTLDACWIAVDVWSNSSRCRQESVYLSRTWCLYTWSYLDILVTMLNSINCSTVIRLPTIILMLLREATSETYGPRVYLLSYKLSIYFYLHLYFSNLNYKIPKIYLSYHIISIRSHFRKWPWRDWQPLYCVGWEFLFVCVGAWDFWGASYWIDTLVLKKWGKYLCYFTASPFPLQGKTNAVLKR